MSKRYGYPPGLEQKQLDIKTSAIDKMRENCSAVFLLEFTFAMLVVVWVD